MSKKIIFDTEFQNKMLSGVNKLADAVKTTLGPAGRNTLLSRATAAPLVTNDGVTIAQDIDLVDDEENMGAKIIREAAHRTGDAAGDGTTTATVLAHFILREGMKNIAAGANPIELKKGILGAAQLSAIAIRKLSKPADTKEILAGVAAISADDKTVGAMIAEAIERVGANGVITIEESSGTTTELDVKDGMQFDRGYLSPEMATDKDRMIAELKNPYILVTDRKITDPQELLPIVEKVKEKGGSLLVIADEVEGQALGFLVMNTKAGIIKAVAVRAPAYGDGRVARLEDIALLTGGDFFSETMGNTIREATLDSLGRADSVTVSKNNTVIVGGAGDREQIADWVKATEARIEKTDYDFAREQLKERLALMAAGVAVIRIGAFSEAEMKEKKARVDDALHAAKAAAKEGIVPGGGVVYLHIMPAIRTYIDTLEGDRTTGAKIVLKALEAPARQIAENAGADGSVVIHEMKNRPAGTGFNAATRAYENMIEANIIDSAMVTRLALQSAASAAAMLLTAGAGITEA